MIIREYRPTDFGQIEELWKRTGIYAVERGDTGRNIERCIRYGGKFLVLEEKATGRVIGTSWMTYDGRRVHLHHFAIAPEYQGKGLGRLLARESLKFPHELGCPVKLEVQRDNQPAIHLYRSLGFASFEDYDVYMNLDPGASLTSKK